MSIKHNSGLATPDTRRWTRILGSYRTPNHVRSVAELVITALPLVTLWTAAWFAFSLVAGLVTASIGWTQFPAAMGAVIDPFAGCGNPLASGDHRGMPDYSDQFTVAARLNPQNAVAIPVVVVCDALNKTGENFPA